MVSSTLTPDNPKIERILASDPDKSHRARVHSVLRRFCPVLVLNTVTNSQKEHCVSVAKRFLAPEMRGKRKLHSEVSPQQRFLMFHLRKCNRETNDVLHALSRAAGISVGSFTYAGTKVSLLV